MQRIDEDAVVNITSGHGVTPVNGFSEGDPTVPRQGTQVSADWCNQVQEELLNIIEEAGLTPDSTFVQLLAGLRLLLLDVQGGVGQTIAKNKIFQDGIAVTRSTANSTAIAGTGNGTGGGVNGTGGTSSAGNGSVGVLGVGGAASGTTGNAGMGGEFLGTGFNAAATGNTSGAAGVGATVTGGSIASDTNARTGGTGIVVSGGTGQAGRGKAIDAQNGDVNINSGKLTFGAGGSIAIPTPTTIVTGSGPGTYDNGWGADTSGSKQGAHYILEPTTRKFLEGSVIGGSSLSVAFVLPTALCPSVPKLFTCSTDSLNVFAQVFIDTTGHVTIDFPGGGSSTSVCLDGINYL